MIKRIMFSRVERWIATLPMEYRHPGYIRSSLGLLRVIGLPTDFGGLITKKLARGANKMGREAAFINLHQIKYDGHATRRNELRILEKFL